MNNKRRYSLKKACDFLTKASDIIESVKSEEEDSADNIPENLQESEKYEKMASAIDYMEDAITNIDDAKSNIDSAII